MRIAELQSVQQWWEKKVIPEEHRTPDTRLDRATEEWEELVEAHGNEHSNKEKALEAIDVIIVLSGYIDSLGYDLEGLFVEKMEINHKKYNVVRNQKLRDNGLEWDEAMQVQKDAWNLK